MSFPFLLLSLSLVHWSSRLVGAVGRFFTLLHAYYLPFLLVTFMYGNSLSPENNNLKDFSPLSLTFIDLVTDFEIRIDLIVWAFRMIFILFFAKRCYLVKKERGKKKAREWRENFRLNGTFDEGWMNGSE